GRCGTLSGRCDTPHPVRSVVDFDPDFDQPGSIVPQAAPGVAQHHAAALLARYGTYQCVEAPATSRVVAVGEHVSGDCLADPMPQPSNGRWRIIQRQITSQQQDEGDP